MAKLLAISCDRCFWENSEEISSTYKFQDDRGGAGGGVQKVEEKIVPLRPENDILITFSNFAAKKGISMPILYIICICK